MSCGKVRVFNRLLAIGVPFSRRLSLESWSAKLELRCSGAELPLADGGFQGLASGSGLA